MSSEVTTTANQDNIDLTSKDVMKRVWKRYLVQQRHLIIIAIISAVFVAITSALAVEWLDPMTNLVFKNASPTSRHLPSWAMQNPFVIAPLVMVIITLVRLMAQLAMAISVNKAGHKLVGQIQSELFANLVHADLGRLQQAHSGTYLSSILFDAGLMREAATNGIVNYVQNTLIVVSALVVMAYTDWLLTLFVLISGPIISVVLSSYNRRTKKASTGAMNETSSLSTAIMEGLDGIKIVKINNQEAAEIGRVDAVIERRQNHIIKGANARASASPATEAITQTVLALVIAYAGWRSQSGHMSVGGFLAFIAALGMAGQSLRQVANLQTVMAEGFTATRRLFKALDIAPEIEDAKEAKILAHSFTRIEAKNLSFAYGTGEMILRDVSFTAKSGETIALVGASGSGKSTLMNLFPRFYDQKQGLILIDGEDHRHFSLKSLRDQIALVTQDPFLFDDTIAANITYGTSDATTAEIEQAAKDAAAHDFILSLPKGYETRVGEAGSRLSGGQKQRIAIARAFLKNAPLLLLDEATSALDSQSEALIQTALERLMSGRTTIMIAHRLSTVQHADQILVMDRGQIVEQGTHDELLASGGVYAALASKQFAPSQIEEMAIEF